MAALLRKHAARVTLVFIVYRKGRSTIFIDVYRTLVRKAPDELNTSKFVDSLLARRGGSATIPPRLRSDCSWAMKSLDKVDEFAGAFRGKSQLLVSKSSINTRQSQETSAFHSGAFRFFLSTR